MVIMVLVVIHLDDDIAAGQLRLKVKRRGSPRARKRADDGPPIRPVRMNRPDAPEQSGSEAHVFEAGEDDAAVLEDYRM